MADKQLCMLQVHGDYNVPFEQRKRERRRMQGLLQESGATVWR